MGLSGPQMQDLLEAMTESFTEASLTIFLRIHLDKDLDNVAEAGTKPVRVFATLEDAERHGWLRDLLHELSVRGPNPDIRNIAARIAAELGGNDRQGAGGPDPLHACVVGRRAFVDREEFRRVMRDLIDEQGKVAVVKGPNGGGNTHSWFFIEHLARETGTARARLVDLKKWKSADAPSPAT